MHHYQKGNEQTNKHAHKQTSKQKKQKNKPKTETQTNGQVTTVGRGKEAHITIHSRRETEADQQFGEHLASENSQQPQFFSSWEGHDMICTSGV